MVDWSGMSLLPGLLRVRAGRLFHLIWQESAGSSSSSRSTQDWRSTEEESWRPGERDSLSFASTNNYWTQVRPNGVCSMGRHVRHHSETFWWDSDWYQLNPNWWIHKSNPQQWKWPNLQPMHMWCNKSLPNMTSPLILWGCSGKTLQGVSWRRRSAPQRLQRRVELLDKTRVAPAKSNISSSAQTQSAEGDLNSDTSDVSTFDNHNQSIYHSIVLFLKGSPELKYNIWGWRLDQLSFKHCQRHNGPRVLSLYLE